MSKIDKAYEVIAKDAVKAIRSGMAKIETWSEPHVMEITCVGDSHPKFHVMKVEHRMVLEWTEYPE